MKNSKNYKFFFLILGIFISITSEAQLCYTADEDTVCVGTQVNFTRCPDWTNVSFDFGTGVYEDDKTTHTYTEAKTWYVYQTGNRPDPNNPDLKSTDTIGPLRIVVLPLLPPSFTVANCVNGNFTVTITDPYYENFRMFLDGGEMPISRESPWSSSNLPEGNKVIRLVAEGPKGCSTENAMTVYAFPSIPQPSIQALRIETGNQIDLDFDLSLMRDYLNYRVEQKDNNGIFQKVADLEKVNNTYPPQFAVINVNTSVKSYCLRLVAFDDCGTSVPSEEVCSILLNATAINDRNNISWSMDRNYSDFSFYINQASSSLPGNQNTFLDEEVRCNENYCYKIIGRSDSKLIHSNTVCVIGRSEKTPSTIENFTASVVNNNAEISWRKPEGMTVKEYKLVKFIDFANQTIYSGSDSVYQDLTYTPNSSCYSISYIDVCENKSEASLLACPIHLSGKIVKRNENSLTWSEYKGWKKGVEEYIMEVLDSEGNIVRTVPIGSSASYNDTYTYNFQVIRYRIKAISEGGALTTFSNIFEIKQNFIIALPNAFSPNNDNLNDHFELVERYIKEVKMRIFNKWGELIFEGERWDGNGKKGKASEGIYIYYIEAEDEIGEKISKKGTVTLIR